jgi:hypothetical protein
MEKFTFIFLVHTEKIFNIFGGIRKRIEEERKKAFLLQNKSMVVEIQKLRKRIVIVSCELHFRTLIIHGTSYSQKSNNVSYIYPDSTFIKVAD